MFNVLMTVFLFLDNNLALFKTKFINTLVPNMFLTSKISHNYFAPMKIKESFIGCHSKVMDQHPILPTVNNSTLKLALNNPREPFRYSSSHKTRHIKIKPLNHPELQPKTTHQ